MADKPTPGSTGDAGDAGQLGLSGEIRNWTAPRFAGADLLNVHFHPDAGDGGGAGGSGDGGEGGEGSGGEPDAGASGDKDTLTKAEVEQIVQSRLAAERRKFADYDEAKTKAAEYDKLEEAKKSEVDKANERAAQAERDKADREADLRTERVSNAVTLAASGMGFVNPSVAHRLVDPASLEFDDDGKPKKDSVEQALKALVTSDPYLVGRSRPRGDGGGGPRGSASGGEKSMSERIRELAGSKRVSSE